MTLTDPVNSAKNDPRPPGQGQAGRPRQRDQLEPHPGRQGPRGLEPPGEQLLAAREGAAVERHPVVEHADAGGAELTMRVFTGLTLLDTIQGTVGVAHPDAITPHEEAVYTNIAFMESVHEELLVDLLDAVLDEGHRRGVPLVGREREPAEEGRDRHGVLPGRLPAEAQGGLDAARVLLYSGFYLPMHWSSRAKLTNTADLIRHHPRRGRARLLHRLQVPEGPRARG